MTTAAFSPDGSLLVVVDGNERRARIWNVATAQPGAVVPRAGRRPTSSQRPVRRGLAADPHRRQRPAMRRSRIWQAARVTRWAGTSCPRRRWRHRRRSPGRPRHGHWNAARLLRHREGATPAARSQRAPVKSLAFDRAGELIATGGQRGTTIAWDARTLEPTPLRAPGGDITSATFSPDGDLVLVTSGATTRLWDRTLPRVIVELPQTPDARAELSRDGSRIVIAGKTRLQVVRCDACAPLPSSSGALARSYRSVISAWRTSL